MRTDEAIVLPTHPEPAGTGSFPICGTLSLIGSQRFEYGASRV